MERILQEKVLRAYLRRNPIYGYIQGMNYVVQYFLRVFSYNVDDAFWAYAHIIEVSHPVDYFNNLSGVSTDCHVIEYLLEKKHSGIIDKFNELGVIPRLYVAEMLISFFVAKNLKPKQLDFIWDVFIIYGNIEKIRQLMLFFKKLERIFISKQSEAVEESSIL